MKIPNFVWWIIGIAIVLVVLVLLKIEFHIGASGIGITQSLIR